MIGSPHGTCITIPIVPRRPPPFSLSLRPLWPLRGMHRNANVCTSAFYRDVDASSRRFRRRRIDGVGGAGAGLV